MCTGEKGREETLPAPVCLTGPGRALELPPAPAHPPASLLPDYLSGNFYCSPQGHCRVAGIRKLKAREAWAGRAADRQLLALDRSPLRTPSLRIRRTCAWWSLLQDPPAIGDVSLCSDSSSLTQVRFWFAYFPGDLDLWQALR